MSRLSFVPTDQWPQDLREFTQVGISTELELGVTRMMAHAPEAAMAACQFVGGLTTTRTLPERLIELLRLRVAFHNQCRSCMAIRYNVARPDLSEDEVCSLETPEQVVNLSDRERLAVELGDRFACNHLSIDEAFFDQLKAQFTEAEIIELLLHCALYVGMGRMAAVLDMTEDLPEGFNVPFSSDNVVTPSAGQAVTVG